MNTLQTTENSIDSLHYKKMHWNESKIQSE